MQLYYQQNLAVGLITLSAQNAAHVGKVLRMKNGDTIQITNGQGNYAKATIVECDKTNCVVQVNEVQNTSNTNTITLAIAFTKNTDRIEWLLEKVTELGVAAIIPLNCTRSEAGKYKVERLHNILISAMCQSKQYFLPTLCATTNLLDINFSEYQQCLLAHCIPTLPRKSITEYSALHKTLVLIGPEGDFTSEEITQLTTLGCTGISLGATRLRTETAGLAAVAALQMGKIEQS